MNTKLEAYRVFCEVAENKSISKASEKLFISQSAVSQTIKQLEKELDMQLFIRNSKGVELTGSGEVLYQYSKSAVDLLNEGISRLQRIKELKEGELRIGAGDTVSRYLLSEKLETFHKKYPSVNLSIVNRTSYEAVELLKSGKIDVAFVNLPIETDESIKITEYIDIHDIFVGSSNNKLYKTKTYSLSELSKLPLVLLEKKSNSRMYIDKFFLKNGFVLTPEIELGSHDLLLEFAKINLGAACVVKEFSKEYLDDKSLVEIKTEIPIPKRSIGIATLKSVDLSEAAKLFLNI